MPTIDWTKPIEYRAASTVFPARLMGKLNGGRMAVAVEFGHYENAYTFLGNGQETSYGTNHQVLFNAPIVKKFWTITLHNSTTDKFTSKTQLVEPKCAVGDTHPGFIGFKVVSISSAEVVS